MNLNERKQTRKQKNYHHGTKASFGYGHYLEKINTEPRVMVAFVTTRAKPLYSSLCVSYNWAGSDMA